MLGCDLWGQGGELRLRVRCSSPYLPFQDLGFLGWGGGGRRARRQAPTEARKPGGKGPGRPREVSAGQRAADWGVWEVFVNLTDPPRSISPSVRVRILVMYPCSHQVPWEENLIYNKVNLLEKSLTPPTFFIHSQHCGPTTQQGLHHRSQTIPGSDVERPYRRKAKKAH